MRVVNRTKNTILMEKGKIAKDFFSRGIGLLSRSGLANGEGLIISRTQSVHSFFMRFPIDVVWGDKNNKVVHLHPNMVAWRVSRHVFRSRYVVELPVGTINSSQTTLGDILEIGE